MQGQLSELKKLWRSPRMLLSQSLNLAMIVFSALMIWKGLMFLTKSESPVVVVLRYVDVALSLCPPVFRSAAVCLLLSVRRGLARVEPLPPWVYVAPVCFLIHPLETSKTALAGYRGNKTIASALPAILLSLYPFPPSHLSLHLQWVHGARLSERRHSISQQPRGPDPRGRDCRVQDQGP